MYCPNCKQEYDGKFCPECGTKLIEKHAVDENVSMGVNINLGDANAISGGVHVVNNTTYVQEREKSATEIEQEQRIQFMNLCEEVFEDGIIDEHENVKLETERLRLGLDEATAKRIIETSRNASQTLKRELSPRDAIYLKTALQYINGNEIERIKTLLPKLEVMNELYKVEEVSFVYNLLLAALIPEKLIRTYEEQMVDSYWQTYWVYIAYLKKAEIVKAEKALSRLNLYTKYPESNGYLLSALSSSFELDTAVAQDLLSVIPSSPCSAELKGFYESLIYEFASQTAGEQDTQCHDTLFYVENIARMDNPYQKAVIKDRTERAIENDKEKEDIEKIFEKGKICNDRGEIPESIKWFHMAADLGHARAQCLLGILYRDGDGVKQDYKEAEKWYRKAAEQGNTDAQNDLGLLYDDGNGVKQDYKEAEKWYRKAAELGNANAQNNLGNLYYYGNGVNQDYKEAEKWYRKAADQGQEQAEENLCSLLKMIEKAEEWANDSYKKGNYTEAAKLYRIVAEKGNVDALFNLGLLYYNGQGVDQDYVEAEKWIRKAAEQGDAQAQLLLGCIYQNGDGINQNYSEAAKWYLKAAEQNDETAQCYLGELYFFGKGVPKDLKEARRLWEMAAKNGDEDALEYLNGKTPEDDEED